MNYLSIDQMPENWGKKGKGFKPYGEYIHNSFKAIHYYASVIGLIFAIISFLFSIGVF